MNHPNLISQICLNCTAGFLVLECANFVEDEGVCEGCEVAHCCRQCGSYNTRSKTEEEKKDMLKILSNGIYVPPVRALYQCGDCGIEFTQRQCASHIGNGTTCMDECKCNGADKDDIHRCPICLTLNGHYAGALSNKV